MKPDTRSFYEDAVLRAAEHVVGSLDEALDLNALAASVNISPFHFHRIFRGVLGETPLELHRRLRLERAAWALIASGDPVTRIAFDAGYETHEAFTRAFRLYYGHAPSGFRSLAAAWRDEVARSLPTELAARSGIHFSPGTPGRVILPPIREGSTMDVTIVERPQLRVAALHHQGAYNQISEVFARLCTIASKAGLLQGGVESVGIFHDDPEVTPEAEQRSEAAVSVKPGAPIPDGLHELTLPAGRYATTRHVGPYQTLGDTWVSLMGQWLPRSGYRLGPTPSYEVYRNDATTTPPADLITDIYLPVVAEVDAAVGTRA